jgi:hypothetical protein
LQENSCSGIFKTKLKYYMEDKILNECRFSAEFIERVELNNMQEPFASIKLFFSTSEINFIISDDISTYLRYTPFIGIQILSRYNENCISLTFTMKLLKCHFPFY